MKTNKKGVELSLNMIIVLAILIVVLIVAILLITGGFEDFAVKLKALREMVWGAKPEIKLTGT
ncbi:MAG: hypothetical protein QME12_03265 [Nanoarchaeota archaeon]|nr:hypothetical protein [Nanoarchaeota archaeon]